MTQYKILIVEDEFITALDLQRTLKKQGYSCQITSTGAEAITFAENEKPNVVLMDINIDGEINGIETAEKIYSKFAIPIIFMTGYSDEENIAKTKYSKPVAVLCKPLDIDVLKATIISAIEKVA
ncbi:MAG: response regulator [Nitrospirae bacterium]|nr:response regulator [Nitrospirota bacterium]MBF0539958.1 response regulator [Nitrospirota bacterium]